MAKPRGTGDIAHRMRHILGLALTRVERISGQDLAELVAREMLEKGVVDIAAKFKPFMPRVVEMTVDEKEALEVSTVDWITLRKAKRDEREKAIN